MVLMLSQMSERGQQHFCNLQNITMEHRINGVIQFVKRVIGYVKSFDLGSNEYGYISIPSYQMYGIFSVLITC